MSGRVALLTWVWLVAFNVPMVIATFRAPACQCGRRRRWMIARFHPTLPGLVAFKIVPQVGMAGVNLVLVPGWWEVPWLLWAAWGAYAVWWHERDRIRRAARAVGRVVVHASGRLVVAPAPARGAA